MSEDLKKQLFALMAHAEEQQKALDKAIETVTKQQAQMEKVQKGLPALASQAFSKSIEGARKSIEGDLNGHANQVAKELETATKEVHKATNAIRNEVKTLDWKHALMTTGGVLGACMLVILGSILLIPSVSDIAERRATVERVNKLGGNLQIATCEGKACVRVMTKKCGYGDTKDYCVIDVR